MKTLKAQIKEILNKIECEAMNDIEKRSGRQDVIGEHCDELFHIEVEFSYHVDYCPEWGDTPESMDTSGRMTWINGAVITLNEEAFDISDIVEELLK